MSTRRDGWSTGGLTLFFVGVALPVVFAERVVPFPPEGDEMEE